MKQAQPDGYWPRQGDPNGGGSPGTGRSGSRVLGRNENPKNRHINLGINSEFEEHTANTARGVPDGARNRIDVHPQYIPDFYREALINAGLGAPDGIQELPAWAAEAALKTMDELQVGTAMLSISSPGVHLVEDKQASHLARQVNEEAQRLRHRYPGRFGHLALRGRLLRDLWT